MSTQKQSAGPDAKKARNREPPPYYIVHPGWKNIRADLVDITSDGVLVLYRESEMIAAFRNWDLVMRRKSE